MKRKLLVPILFIVSMILTGCSEKDDKLFDDSRRCSITSTEVKDAFGKVIQKGSDDEPCPSVEINPCSIQSKNHGMIGEISDDTSSSIIICSGVEETPVLPSDYTEASATPIDLSKSLENIDDPSVIQAKNESRKVEDPEEIPLTPIKNNRSVSQAQNIEVVLDKKEQPKQEIKKQEVVQDAPEEKIKTQNNTKNKKETKKSSPKKGKTANKKTDISKKKKTLAKGKKALEKKSSSKVSSKPTYKLILGPFYPSKIFVPYKVKVELDNHIKKLKAANKKKNSAEWKYNFIIYYPIGATKSQIEDYKEVGTQRTKELLQYALWKEDFTISSFQVLLKVAPSKKTNVNQIDLLIFK